MKNARISELRDGLSKYLDQVRHGETVVVYDRDVPIARIEPIAAADDGVPDWVKDAERRGVIRPPKKPGGVRLSMPPPRAQDGVGLLEALLEERRSGR